ncbi:MAG: ornithine carbamoyltransferase [bacterium]|nr:ornithine carbamoyltransferase [bacterium]
MRHLISLKEQSADDIRDIIALAARIKKKYRAGETTDILHDKTLLMFFQKGSTRTRISFEAGMTELGGHAIYLDAAKTQFALADFRDEIRAAMRFGDILMMRLMRVEDVALAASFDQVPVIDGCSEKYHPCQALGDIFTMAEHSKGLKNVKKVAWLGIENNMSNTLKLACAKLGIEVALVTPEVNAASVDKELNTMANATGKVKKVLDIKEALHGADYVHTDTWMDTEYFKSGKPLPEFAAEFERRMKVFMPYQLNAALIEKYAPKAGIMHCMPMHVGYEITRDAIEHKNSVIFDQAENRKHVQKAILLWLLEKGL